MDLSKQTILITGGTSGIGEKLVEKLSQTNNKVIVVGRNKDKLSTLKNRHKNITTYKIDLANIQEVTINIQSILKSHPELSIIFNNAAVQYTPLLSSPEFKLESVKSEIEINLHTPIIISALFLHHFLSKDKPTAYVNISSGLALHPKTSASVYCATKAAIHSFSQSFRYQLEDTKVSVFEVLLPLVNTPMTHGRGSNKISADAAANAILKGIANDQFEIYVGKSKLIPWISRISPKLMKHILKNG